jgi:ABC-type glutathione transport system ATPase component
MNKKKAKEIALDALAKVGLSPTICDYLPHALSGGMQKRVSLARAICTNPEIIFFDEPTTGLDPIIANVINDLIIKVREELGATTISITHDMNSAHRIASEVSFIYEGKIMWSGKKDEMDKADNPYLHQFIKENNPSNTLIFTRTKRAVDDLYEYLYRKGHNVDSLHGDKSLGSRRKALEKFKKGDVAILVATDVAARGLDVSDISHVINYDLPDTYETYIHRIGRTGRGENVGWAFTIIEG